MRDAEKADRLIRNVTIAGQLAACPATSRRLFGRFSSQAQNSVWQLVQMHYVMCM